ncbi:hypothetical protein [Microbulbifer epialgicus]|uniref:DUF202 domain-containing protein n=1 Tax=Microbulbifer epialgicus TaxID=393907 RepID=A0ABV4P7R3_9GAMM
MGFNQKDREELKKFLQESALALDDRFFTISTGALALSITFREALVPQNPNCIWMLGASWISFSLCILLFLTNRLVWLRRSGIFLELLDHDDEQETAHNYIARRQRSTRALFYMEMLAFISGVGSLVIFALMNIDGAPS